MNCEEIRDLMPSCALGTATADEVRAVEDHLVECGLHEELASLKASAALIASGEKPVEPPASLKAKVMAHANAPSIDNSANPGSGRLLRLSRLVVGNPIAAVLVVMLVVMGAWNVTLRSADQPEKFVHYYWGQDDNWLRLETVLGDAGAEVSLGGFERLDASQLYHLWTTRGEQVFLVGAFNVNPEGRWAGMFEFIFEEGDRVWMTPESAVGTEEPTGDPVLKTRF